MKLGSLASARSAYYDRNATSTYSAPGGAYYSPHSQTTRATVTVATGRKLLIESVYLFMQRTSVATVLSGAGMYVAVDGNVVSTTNVVTNTALYTAVTNLFGNVTVYAGSAITIVTYDFSTGGQIYYDAVWRGTTFDA